MEGIKLKNIDLTGISKEEQFRKVKEELIELNNALIEDEYYTDVEGDKTELRLHIIEEYFDVVQSYLGLLEKHGISAEEAMKEYPKHLEKLKNRPREKKCSKCIKYSQHPNKQEEFLCLKNPREIKKDTSLAEECKHYKEWGNNL